MKSAESISENNDSTEIAVVKVSLFDFVPLLWSAFLLVAIWYAQAANLSLRLGATLMSIMLLAVATHIFRQGHRALGVISAMALLYLTYRVWAFDTWS
jgi:hypothetical protein